MGNKKEYPDFYPVFPLDICRHLSCCVGTALDYVLRAPWIFGRDDCRAALLYLRHERKMPRAAFTMKNIGDFYRHYTALMHFLAEAKGDMLWQDIAAAQNDFLIGVNKYVLLGDTSGGLEAMEAAARDLDRVLSLRDTTGQIYEGMTGLPRTEVKDGQE